MPLIHLDDAVLEPGGEIVFWMVDSDSCDPVKVEITREAMAEFMSFNGIKGTRRKAFEANRSLFYELASASFDLFGGSADRPVVIKSNDLGAFPAVRRQFPNLKLR